LQPVQNQVNAISSQLLTRKKPADDDQLLRLFWNRAELKKEFAGLRRERDRLTEQLRQQEGATLRAQQRLEQLEGLLADPAKAANAAVYYQLRGIWNQCRRRLGRLASDFSARQLEREKEHALARLAEHRETALGSLDRRIEELRGRRQSLQADLGHLAERRARLSLWRFIQRRNLLAQEQALDASLASVTAQLSRQESFRQEKLDELTDPEAELSIAGRRAVNISVIALGQELLLHYQQHNIARMARDAASRKISTVNYGGSEQCRELSQLIELAQRRLDGLPDLPARVRRRSEALSREAHYRRESDTVPVAGSFDLIALEPGEISGLVARNSAIPVNILAEEYWDIYKVLLN